jgi:hypothetical protein
VSLENEPLWWRPTTMLSASSWLAMRASAVAGGCSEMRNSTSRPSKASSCIQRSSMPARACAVVACVTTGGVPSGRAWTSTSRAPGWAACRAAQRTAAVADEEPS